MEKILDRIVKENDIKDISPEDYRELAKEIRRKLVRTISRTGGHLASNLGAVELTMALHILLDFPEDKLVWDVGHQSYVHKILTGRGDDFRTLRCLDGISGFPKVEENPCDTFDTGHSSTSISVALGLAKARDLQGGMEKVFAVIGDGALSGGMAFEALNNAAQLKSNMVIVLNDNKMSIAPNVGGMSNYLGKIRTNQKYRNLKENVEQALDRIPNLGQPIAMRVKKAKDSLKRLFIPGMLFEDMGIIYMGPVDGHNIQEMLTAFRTALTVKDQPVLVHVLTKKGKGYRPAEQRPADFHGVGPFDIRTGKIQEKEELTYTKIFGQWMIESAKIHKDLVSVCAAMPDGTGLAGFAKENPDRFFDVGIAEEHAVTFAAGMAAGGLKPVVSLYSTFMQRAYDQILHDVCISKLPVLFTLDRSGIVGKDGETHQGIFDLSYLSSIPNMHIMAPKNKWELSDMLKFAVDFQGPIALRYPRGEAFDGLREHREPIILGMGEWIYHEKDIVLVAVGSMVKTALAVREAVQLKGYACSIINARFVKPIDTEILNEALKDHSLIVTMEENVASGGFGEKVREYLDESGYQGSLLTISIPDEYVEHGNVEILREEVGIDAYSIQRRIEEVLCGQ